MNAKEITAVMFIAFACGVIGLLLGMGIERSNMQTKAVRAGVAYYENNRTNQTCEFTFITNK